MCGGTENVSHHVWIWVEVDGGELVSLGQGGPGLDERNLRVVTDRLDVVRVGLALRPQDGHHSLGKD